MNNQVTEILFQLYKLQKFNGECYYSFFNLCEKLDKNLSSNKMKALLTSIFNRGYIKIYSECGIPFVKITLEGENFIDFIKYNSDIIIDYKGISVYDSSLFLSFRKPIFDILDIIKKELIRKRKNKTDIGKSLSILYLEISKEHPNMEIIKILLTQLKDYKAFMLYLEQLEIILS